MSDQRAPRDDPGFRPGKGNACNDEGQILLHPSVPIPDGEAWLWKNPAVRTSMERALRQAADGEFQDLGSFADNDD